MTTKNQGSSVRKRSSFELARWYCILAFVLAILSLVTANRNVAGAWEVTLGIRETTPILVALAILPFLLRFVVAGTRKGKLGVPGLFETSWDNSEINKEITNSQKKHEMAGEAVKDQTKSQRDIEEIRGDADIDLEKTVTPQELPFVQQVYLQKLNEMVKDFNRNRHNRPSGRSTPAEAEEIAYRMRSMAPLLFGQLDILTWLHIPNMGKQLAAIKYLDWAQDIEFAETLAERLQELENNRDTFQAYHVLLALYSMADQLSYNYKDKVKELLEAYKPSGTVDSSRANVKGRILGILRE